MGGRNAGREEISESASTSLSLRIGHVSRGGKKSQVAVCGHKEYTYVIVIVLNISESLKKGGRDTSQWTTIELVI